MSRDREAGATSPGAPPPVPRSTDFVARAAGGTLPLALLAAAVVAASIAAIVAALVASQALLPAWLIALALLLTAAGALASGALWGQGRRVASLHQASMHSRLMDQLVDAWGWQTDAQHRLVSLRPPPGDAGGDGLAGATPGRPLWQQVDDAGRNLQPRMAAQGPLGDLLVQPLQPAPDLAGQRWRLRGLPQFDVQGRFSGYLGLAWPAAPEGQASLARQALDGLLLQGPVALCLAVPAADGQGWRLQRASPAARALLGLDGPPDGSQPWAQALAGLPDGLRQRALGLHPGETADAPGWRLRLDQLGGGDAGACAALLLALAPLDDGSDSATQSLAAEHAAFSYTISHDLRAPIRVVEGFGRILKEDYGAVLDRVGRDHIDRITAAAARMNHMIDALLSLSRLSTQPLARQPVNLSQLAGWVVDELRRAAPERQAAVHIAPGMSALGDPTLLRTVLENLLGNAWKYSARQAQAEIRFEPAEPGGRAAFVVSDNGAGFDMRFADRLFGVFQRLHSASDFPGTGIGLASVRRIVRRHGGEIWAESDVGQGARFYFTLKSEAGRDPS